MSSTASTSAISTKKKGGRKSRPCEAGHCNETDTHLHQWPKDKAVAAAWTKWVGEKRSSFQPDHKSVLCYRHFLESDYTNMGRYKQGLCQR